MECLGFSDAYAYKFCVLIKSRSETEILSFDHRAFLDLSDELVLTMEEYVVYSDAVHSRQKTGRLSR